MENGMILDTNTIKKEKSINVKWSDLNNKIDGYSSIVSAKIRLLEEKKKYNKDVVPGVIKSLQDVINNLNKTQTLFSAYITTKNEISATDDLYTKFLEYTYFVELQKSNYDNIISNFTILETTKDL